MAGSVVPVLVILVRGAIGALGANPIATVLNQLGFWRCCCCSACLACTPLRVAFKWNWPIRIRRTLGLLGASAALLHFLTYAVLDQLLVLRAIYLDIAKRPFILVGFAALVILAPLAVTSTKNAVQRMGFQRWKLLHRLVYLVGVLGVVHFYLRVKRDHTEPLIFAGFLGVFFALRIVESVRTARRKKSRAARA